MRRRQTLAKQLSLPISGKGRMARLSNSGGHLMVSLQAGNLKFGDDCFRFPDA